MISSGLSGGRPPRPLAPCRLTIAVEIWSVGEPFAFLLESWNLSPNHISNRQSSAVEKTSDSQGEALVMKEKPHRVLKPDPRQNRQWQLGNKRGKVGFFRPRVPWCGPISAKEDAIPDGVSPSKFE